MKNKTRRQHYVPQLHLKHFSNIKRVRHKKENYVFYYDKKNEIKDKINIKHAAMENYFYGEDIIGQTIENSLRIFESNINKHIYRDIISFKDPNIFEIPKYKMLFSQFLAVQFNRTKHLREDLKVQYKMIKEHLIDDVKNLDNDFGKLIKEMDSDEFVKKIQLNFFKEEAVKHFAEIFYNKKWVLLVNDTEIPFCTSDNPITRFNPFNLDPYPNLGLISWGIQIYFPLNNKLCLCMLDPERYSSFNNIEKIDPEYVPQNIYEVKKVSIKVEDVIFLNSLQVKECYRLIFSKIDDFKLAEKMVKEDPKIKDLENKAELTVQKNWKPGSDLIVMTNRGYK
ncbi:MAG: DUF4238 domain-containing protein [Methanobacterium sp.]